jgi:hypothetical protein
MKRSAQRFKRLLRWSSADPSRKCWFRPESADSDGFDDGLGQSRCAVHPIGRGEDS